MAKSNARCFRNAEALYRREQEALARLNRENVRSERDHPRYAGAGMLGRALDTMSSCYNPPQRVRWEPPKPRDGAGRPLFGRYRGAK
jgi:hypothetical protein